MTQNSKLVWSNDPKDQKCPRCREFLKNCKCRIERPVEISQVTAVFRIEKNGRGGKTVTVLDQLPANESFLKDLVKTLKNKCGTGGTFNIDGNRGMIEIQGDQRPKMKAHLDSVGIKYKGV